VSDDKKTCANCGNTQAAGDFCEKCGTRFTPAAEEAAPSTEQAAQAAESATPPADEAAAAAGAPPAPSPVPPAPGTYQPGAYQPGAYAPGAPPYPYPPQAQYAPPRPPGPWSKLLDTSFQGFLTAETLKTLWFIVLGIIGLYSLFGIIYGAIAAAKAGGWQCLWIFITLATAAFLFFISRMVFEMAATLLKLRDKS
jgi:hypothetical protein